MRSLQHAIIIIQVVCYNVVKMTQDWKN